MARWLRFFVSLGVLAGLVGLALPSQEAVAKTPSGEQADPEPLSLEDTVDLSVEDIQAFWKKEFPATFKGRRYEPIPASQIFPYDTTTGFPGCGDATPRPYIKNARYCPLDDTVAYDIEGLFPEQYNDFGNFAVAMILAHEWGCDPGTCLRARARGGGRHSVDRPRDTGRLLRGHVGAPSQRQEEQDAPA